MSAERQGIVGSLTIFFVSVFVTTWAIWLTTIAQQHGWISFHIPQALAFWIGLFVVTYVVAFATDGRDGVNDLFRRATRWRVGGMPYLLAIGMPMLIASLAYLIASVLHNHVRIGREEHLAAIPFVLLMSLWLFLMTEETAWRGFALPRLQALLKDPLQAGIVMGVIWAIWHLLLFFISDSFQEKLPLIGFTVATIATSVLVTWIFDLSKGSVLVCAIFHALTDTSLLYFDVMSNRQAFWITVCLQLAVGLFSAYKLSLTEAPLPEDLDYGT